MSKLTSTVTHLAVGAVICTAAALAGSGAGGSSQPDRTNHPVIEYESLDQAEMMAVWAKLAAPSKAHSFFDQFVGEWEMTVRIFMAPGADPMVSIGTSINEMILGGRYLKSTSSYNFMGQQVDGINFTGFDNGRKLFNSMYLSTMETGMRVMTGSLDPTGKTLTQFGEMDEFMTGEYGKPYRMVTRVQDADTHFLEVSEVIYGDPWTVIQIEYRRKKN